MTKHVIEIAVFKLEDGVSKEAFLEAAKPSADFVKARPGFIARRLSCAEDGTWTEHIEWASMEDARSAAAAFGTSEAVKPFRDCIDGSSVRLTHAELEMSLG